jgi:hypothetical protein
MSNLPSVQQGTTFWTIEATEKAFVNAETARIYNGLLGRLELYIIDNPFKSWFFGWFVSLLISILCAALFHAPWPRRDRDRINMIVLSRYGGICFFFLSLGIFIVGALNWGGSGLLYLLFGGALVTLFVNLPIWLAQGLWERRKAIAEKTKETIEKWRTEA